MPHDDQMIARPSSSSTPSPSLHLSNVTFLQHSPFPSERNELTQVIVSEEKKDKGRFCVKKIVIKVTNYFILNEDGIISDCEKLLTSFDQRDLKCYL